MTVTFSSFSESLVVESAFAVLRRAKELLRQGKDVVELEIGDSPFRCPEVADQAISDAISRGITHYCPSLGIPELREAAAEFVRDEFSIPANPQNIAVSQGGKPFEQYFCEAFLNPGHGVLVFSPHFPTYEPNITRRGARMVLAELDASNGFRPRIRDVEHFLTTDPNPKAIFLNSPHNPTGGVMTEQDVAEVADLVRGKDIVVFSDEPYCHMVWQGKHHSIAAVDGMLSQAVAAYTFSKSYSMSGWRLGFCVASEQTIEVIGKMINTATSCTPPFIQHAGVAVLQQAAESRQHAMDQFREQVRTLADGLAAIPRIQAVSPVGTFYVFANVSQICQAHDVTSHGLALYLLEAADNHFGVACLGGESFGRAGQGFIRFSCAEPVARLQQATTFIAQHVGTDEPIREWAIRHGHQLHA